MIDYPLRFLVEQGTTGVNIDLVVVSYGLVSFLGIFLGGMEEKSSNDGFPD